MDLMGLLSGAWAKVEPKIESKVNQVIDVQFWDKQLIEYVCAHLLKKYGNEVYYNDLDSYITSNHVSFLICSGIHISILCCSGMSSPPNIASFPSAVFSFIDVFSFAWHN